MKCLECPRNITQGKRCEKCKAERRKYLARVRYYKNRGKRRKLGEPSK